MSYLGFVLKVFFASAAIAIAIKAGSAIAIPATDGMAFVFIATPAALVACVLAGRALQFSRRDRIS